MRPTRSLRRLHKLREAEEEQRQILLQRALGELRTLESAMQAAQDRLSCARDSLRQGLQSGEPSARLFECDEIAGSQRLIRALNARHSMAQEMVEKLREGLLAKRVERQQSEILLDTIIDQQELTDRRKDQIALDDWFRSRCDGAGTGPSRQIRANMNSPDTKRT